MAPIGTVALREVAIQPLVAAVTPLNVTVPVLPKLLPVIVTIDPTKPELGEILLIIGVPAGGTHPGGVGATSIGELAPNSRVNKCN